MQEMFCSEKTWCGSNKKALNDLKLQKAHEDKVAAGKLDAAKALAEEIERQTIGIKD